MAFCCLVDIRILRESLLLVTTQDDSILESTRPYKYNRMAFFNCNKEEVSDKSSYLRHTDPARPENFQLVGLVSRNSHGRLLLYKDSDKNNLSCLSLDGTVRYGIPQEVKSRGWKDYWWQR